jgi:hypothetical protein
MQRDRYLKIVLTVIAIELFWLGLKDWAPRVLAQAEPSRVVITGVDGGFLPVALAGQTVNAGTAPLRPVQVGVNGAVTIRTSGPLKIEADRPLKVDPVPYTPTQRPGE